MVTNSTCHSDSNSRLWGNFIGKSSASLEYSHVFFPLSATKSSDNTDSYNTAFSPHEIMPLGPMCTRSLLNISQLWFLLHNQETFMNSCFPQPLGNQFPSRNLCPCTVILTYQVSLKELCVIKYKCPCLMIKNHVELSTSFLQGCVCVYMYAK